MVVVTGERRTIQLSIAPGLKTGPVQVWKSTAAAQFIQQPPLSLHDNTVELEPNAIYTFTSTTGQQKGSHGTPPARKPFPFPFEENFESYRPGDTPRYFSDQKGTFEVYQWPKGGLCLAQIVPAQGILWYENWLLKPHTLFGGLTGRALVIDDVGKHVEAGGGFNVCDTDVQSEACLPLLDDGRDVVGIVDAEAKPRSFYGATRLATLAALAIVAPASLP